MASTTATVTTTQNGPDTVTATPLTIGPVTFRRQECPAEIPGLGAGNQKLVAHEFTGGSLVINKFGAFPDPVSWTGFLYQPFLDSRVTTLRQLMSSGNEVPLTWRTEKWFGIVKDFDPGYKHGNKTNYKISVQITRSANGALSSAIAASLDSQIAALLSGANSAVSTIVATDPAAPATLTPLLAQVGLNVQAAGPLAQAAGSPASTNLSASISQTLGVASSYLSSTPQTGPTFVAARQLVSSLNLMQTNVMLGQSTTKVNALNGSSTYELASTQYGDITQGLNVANFNNAVSPRFTVTGTTPTILPSYATNP